MRSLIGLTVCSWDTASLEPAAHASALAAARSHSGAAIIETCQRVEAVSLEPCVADCPQSQHGEVAFRYLVRLAAGLESIVLGESEIVGQVREAARVAPPELAALLGRAIATARAFRRQQEFRTDSGNLFDLTLSKTGRSPEHVMIIGSGPTARCLVRRVRRDRLPVTIVSRRMPDWITDLQAPWISLESIERATPTSLAMVCLGGDATALSAERVPAAVLVDLSTPRRTPADASIVTLRDLRTHAFEAEAERRAELLAALECEADRALAAWASDGSSPVGRFRQSAELIRREETQRLARRHPEIPAETLEAITRRLLNRLLHAPSMRMRQLDEVDSALVAGIFEHEPGRTRRWPE